MAFPSLTEDKSVTSALCALTKEENLPLLQGLLKGIEKEGLRVTKEGKLCLTDHPISLGSALTHPHITTDFSESLLEFITSPTHLNSQLLDDMSHLHNYSYSGLGEEVIWPLSMPCTLPNDDDIPVARYGTSNRAQMKTIYREGLGLRYGRTMQTVAGLHYNFSLPRAFWAFLHHHEGSTKALDSFTTEKYFHLIRNFRRFYWLLIYLFGASPAVDASFVKDRPHNLQKICPNTYGLPYATSLRMGDLGYQSSAQSSLFVCYNALKTYTTTLGNAIRTPYEGYQNIERDNLRQLNSSLLQIENEFYSAIRPKRTAHSGETALTALCHRGVEYLEVRCMDLDPFEANGIAKETVKFLDTFLIYCLLLPSPKCTTDEFGFTQFNQKKTVAEGRNPSLKLTTPDGNEVLLRDWGLSLVADMQAIAQMMDKAHHCKDYSAALLEARNRLESPELTPSARIMALHQSGMSHCEFGLQQAELHKSRFADEPLAAEPMQRLLHMSKESLELQHSEESEPQIPFEEYLKLYYQQYQDCCKQQAG